MEIKEENDFLKEAAEYIKYKNISSVTKEQLGYYFLLKYNFWLSKFNLAENALNEQLKRIEVYHECFINNVENDDLKNKDILVMINNRINSFNLLKNKYNELLEKRDKLEVKLSCLNIDDFNEDDFKIIRNIPQEYCQLFFYKMTSDNFYGVSSDNFYGV